jgi:hypothetical protein
MVTCAMSGRGVWTGPDTDWPTGAGSAYRSGLADAFLRRAIATTIRPGIVVAALPPVGSSGAADLGRTGRIFGRATTTPRRSVAGTGPTAPGNASGVARGRDGRVFTRPTMGAASSGMAGVPGEGRPSQRIATRRRGLDIIR